MARAKFECPWTGKGTSIERMHESCGNWCHKEPCCLTCCRSCQSTCYGEGVTRLGDRPPEERAPIRR